MNFKWGPMDFRQPSTWRGLAGLAAVFGFSIHPELVEPIAIALGAFLSAIEIGRNEYAHRKAELLPIVLQSRYRDRHDDVPDDDQRLRQPLPPANDPTEVQPPTGCNDR